MKLLTKTTLIYVAIIIAVFTFGGVLSYQIFQKKVNKETDYHLRGQLSFIREVIQKGVPLHALNYEKMQIQLIDSTATLNTRPRFSDTLFMHTQLKRIEPHRKLLVARKIGNSWYRIMLVESLVEGDDISESVTASLSYTFSILVILLVLSSIIISAWIFEPFRKTLKAVSSFNIRDGAMPVLGKTPIKEFTQLNEFLTQMMRKSRQDFLNLKEFIENASHEIQTPLAIARGKMELLINSEGLSDQQAQWIHSAYNSLSRLSKMNRSLGLLSKIENQEFSNNQVVDLGQMLQNKLEDFEELMALKRLRVDSNLKANVGLNIDPMLMDILITNLLQNTVKHNIVEGSVFIRLKANELVIANTGLPLSMPAENMFERFQKGSNSAESHGLGLPIVKKICEVSHMEVVYEVEDSLHTVTLRFESVPLPEKSTAMVKN